MSKIAHSGCKKFTLAVVLWLLAILIGLHFFRLECIDSKFHTYGRQSKNIFLRERTGCHDKKLTYNVMQRGNFWVLENFFLPEVQVSCAESVTLVTHGTFNVLSNLVELAGKWKGPISVAVYAPRDDFSTAIKTILYLKKCITSTDMSWISFHLYFETNEMPYQIPSQEAVRYMTANCSASLADLSSIKSYRKKHNLSYPINVGRNVARNQAQTHYVLVVDIELYPSDNIIPKFLDMITRKETETVGWSKGPKIYGLHVYEVSKFSKPPGTKAELQEMLSKRDAVRFHVNICEFCHHIPQSDEWEQSKEDNFTEPFLVTKRKQGWEPIYIGTNDDPPYDESLSWEGQRDKLLQAYILCLLDYDIIILSNAFLVHKPGIKKTPNDEESQVIVEQKNRIKSQIIPQLNTLYGVRRECSL